MNVPLELKPFIVVIDQNSLTASKFKVVLRSFEGDLRNSTRRPDCVIFKSFQYNATMAQWKVKEKKKTLVRKNIIKEQISGRQNAAFKFLKIMRREIK